MEIALVLAHDLPCDDSLKRWLAEPVKVVVIPCSTFVKNNKGFPVLKKRHQLFIQKMMNVCAFILSNLNSLLTQPKLNIQCVISSPSPSFKYLEGGISAYRQYIQHLYKTRPEPDHIEKISDGYQE